MPELPDIENYLHSLRERVVGQAVEGVELKDLFVLRSVEPSLDSMVGHKVAEARRLGKRIVLVLDDRTCLVIHLMIAGRLRWAPPGEAKWAQNGLVRWKFPTGVLTLTEAGTKRRAKIHRLSDPGGLKEHDPGGLEVLECSEAEFTARLRLRNHTLKRALTDPTLFSGIGNAYSDEILHWARLSPVALTQKMPDEDVAKLYRATVDCLRHWIRLHREEVGEGFPDKVTAFHPKMAMHGKYGEPCPDCGTPVQRIRYADNETNYCARCQTGGKLLADRSLSRLLKKDWPKSIDELA